MALAFNLHTIIEEYNVLGGPTQQIGDYCDDHPLLYKVALLVNHLFRAAAMTGLGIVLPFSFAANAGICFLGSLFYRLTVETHCAYKFALPAFAGSLAFPIAHAGLTNLISGVAFSSISACVITAASFLPLVAYFSYIFLTVSYDVDNR